MSGTLPKELSSLVALDLEVTRRGVLRHIGAYHPDSGQKFDQQKITASNQKNALQGLNHFCKDSNFILGHNILGHDLPFIGSILPESDLLTKPVIDTLYLSPLAFPQNPYHRLIKDYKLVRDAINDPVADAQLSLSIFAEQYQSFLSQYQQSPDIIRFYQFCFASTTVSGTKGDCQGLATVFNSILSKAFVSAPEAWHHFIELCHDRVCRHQAEVIGELFLTQHESRVCFPYCLAWIQVANDNSVLPPWVRHRFPAIVGLLKRLREESCSHSDCSYCQENHNPVRQLNRYFHYPDFRPTKDGRPLQKEIVAAGMNNQPLLGILPTGGGKSICFQIPAFVRYQRLGHLTVVISPLQALMKDQVDNLREKTGCHSVAAVYGMLTPTERGAVLEQLRLGDIALLYISPEQLRNKSVIHALNHREIGCWVFDEAHCLSKWGHDFRPDYLYCGRFIRKTLDNQPSLPSVACYTATAKADVVEDICQHFQLELDQKLELFQGGVERSNLSYEVHLVTQTAKYARVDQLIEERLPSDGSCVVYCATRKKTEELSDFLSRKQRSVNYFHAGLEVIEKNSTLEGFIAGEIQIICATNAFGMGVDKDNVRLVIHADIPGSLENYLQEAGRAGRDQKPAECILLFDEQDIETQFKLGALSEVRQQDIQQLLRGIKKQEKSAGEDVVLTTGELLRSDAVNTSFDRDDNSADTKVKTAIAWLERSGFLQRNENSNQVFQGKALFSSIEEANEKLDKLQLTPLNRKHWETILLALINTQPDDGINADELAESIGAQIKTTSVHTSINTAGIMKILGQMADVGLVSKGLLMTAFIRPKGKNNARSVLQQLCRLELAMLAKLREHHPDDHEQQSYPLNIRALNQALVDDGIFYSNPTLLGQLLKSLSMDGQGLAGSTGSIELTYTAKDHFQVTLRRSWSSIVTIAERRQALSQHILDALYLALPKADESSKSEVKVEFSLEDLRDQIRQDLTLGVSAEKELAAVERGLLFLHELKAINLQNGLAVFRSAMTLKLNQEARSRRYNKGDYEPLARHYKARITQVHVMNEYVRLGLTKMTSALRLVRDYFEQDNVSFLNTYFKGKKPLLELATSQQSLKDIVESLGNLQQQAIVQAPIDRNMLVLAGPGSGKTRVVVHRCAYLMRVKRVRPFSILVLCYNHSAAMTIRKRLQQLLGKEAREVTVQTFHGLAMRLTGTSFDGGKKRSQSEINFAELIPKANDLLRGDVELPGLEPDQLRDKLLGSFQFVLVDEYQDIDAEQYEMITALTGRRLSEGENKLSILAVGDDDQSIYGFRNANIEYIRRFEEDYKADRYHLVQNYRSTHNIIEASNELIQHNRDRMKTGFEIRGDDVRQRRSGGDLFAQLDSASKGKIEIQQCLNVQQQTLGCIEELKRLNTLWPDLQWEDCAILARHGCNHQELTHVRSALEQSTIPYSLPLENSKNLPLFRVREYQLLLDLLHQHRSELADVRQIREWFDELDVRPSTWKNNITDLLDDWQKESSGSELPVTAFTSFVVDYLRESRREQRLGKGVHVGTVHSAKGMEFTVVLLLDGGWQIQPRNNTEEERRLFYVGMTRAKQKLVLFYRQDCQNPHISILLNADTDSLFERLVETNGSYPLKRYQILGLQDLYLSYAGNFSKDHRIHQVLGSLTVDDELVIRPDSMGYKMYAGDQPVAALSKQCAERFNSTFGHVGLIARVVAIVTRTREDSEEAFQKHHRTEQWEIPIVEIVISSY